MNCLFAEMFQKWKKRVAYRNDEHEWNNQFPPISCHPPFVSTDELEELELILEIRRRKRKVLKSAMGFVIIRSKYT